MLHKKIKNEHFDILKYVFVRLINLKKSIKMTADEEADNESEFMYYDTKKILKNFTEVKTFYYENFAPSAFEAANFEKANYSPEFESANFETENYSPEFDYSPEFEAANFFEATNFESANFEIENYSPELDYSPEFDTQFLEFNDTELFSKKKLSWDPKFFQNAECDGDSSKIHNTRKRTENFEYFLEIIYIRDIINLYLQD